ncbi:CsgG/HfaB family protein [Psychrosphaera algicola]|uniref:CsgG/HfaB family protein n=1 Tax=Psychrosphaera algicola TaxID=3023714 RepID=UPI002FEE44E3
MNVATSEIIYSEEATGEATSEANQVFGVGEVAAFNTSLDDKAVSAAISKLVANIMNNLLDKPWKSYVLGVQDQQLIIAGGLNQGLTLWNNVINLPTWKVGN